MNVTRCGTPLPAREIEPRKKLDGHTREVASVAFSADGKIIASGSWDKSVRLWETPTVATAGLGGRMWVRWLWQSLMAY